MEPSIAVTVFVTVGSYIPVTILITEWRSSLRRDMNRTDQAVSARLTDALLNFETVRARAGCARGLGGEGGQGSRLYACVGTARSLWTSSERLWRTAWDRQASTSTPPPCPPRAWADARCAVRAALCCAQVKYFTNEEHEQEQLADAIKDFQRAEFKGMARCAACCMHVLARACHAVLATVRWSGCPPGVLRAVLCSLNALNMIQSFIMWIGISIGLLFCNLGERRVRPPAPGHPTMGLMSQVTAHDDATQPRTALLILLLLLLPSSPGCLPACPLSGLKRGELTVGDMVLFLSLMAQLLAPLNWFGSFYRTIQQCEPRPQPPERDARACHARP